MSKYIIDGSTLINIADSIREITDISDLITPEDMPDKVIECYEQGYEDGKSSATDPLAYNLNDELKTYSSDEVLKVPNYAFWGRSALESVNLSSCNTIETASFQNCTSLKSVNFPNCTAMGGTVFRGCSALENVEFPVLVTTSTYSFAECKSLTRVIFPKLEVVSGALFTNCDKLEYIGLPLATSIGAMTFQNCPSLTTLFIEQSTRMCNLSATTAFVGTPIENGTGFIYVPDNLVEQYKTATNWSTYASQIKPISELDQEV